MGVLLPRAASVRVRETAEELVVEVDLPEEIDICRLCAQLAEGVLEIRLPRVPRRPDRMAGPAPGADGR